VTYDPYTTELKVQAGTANADQVTLVLTKALFAVLTGTVKVKD